MTTILRLASYPTFEESGRGLHCYELSKADNVNVIYLTWFKKNSKPFDVPRNVKLFIRKFYTKANPKNSSIINRILFKIYRLFRVCTFSFHGIYLMFKHKVDIVHIHSPMFIIVSVIASIFKKRNFITFHGEDYFNIKNAKWYKILSRSFDRVFSISPRYINTLKEIHNIDVIQIYNGIDTEIYKNFNNERKKQILAVANFKKQKGLSCLIEGFNKFTIENPNLNEYKLIIAGKGILFDEINLMIKNMNLSNRVFLVGQKNRQELVKLYNESEIFILSSIWEGFAKVLVEAMSCGCKIVSTKVDSAPLLLEDWGYMINHSKPEEISHAFKEVILNNKYPFDKQKEVLNKFTWTNVRDIYSKALKINKGNN